MSRYSFALAGAFFYGIAPVIAKWGLIGGMSQALGTVIMTAAVVPIYYGLLVTRQRSFALPGLDPRTMLFVVLAGVTHTGGTLFQFAALTMEQVSVVLPVVNLYPLVTVAFLLFLGTEKVTRNLVIGTLLVAAGSILVVTR